VPAGTAFSDNILSLLFQYPGLAVTTLASHSFTSKDKCTVLNLSPVRAPATQHRPGPRLQLLLRLSCSISPAAAA